MTDEIKLSPLPKLALWLVPALGPIELLRAQLAELAQAREEERAAKVRPIAGRTRRAEA